MTSHELSLAENYPYNQRESHGRQDRLNTTQLNHFDRDRRCRCGHHDSLPPIRIEVKLTIIMIVIKIECWGLFPVGQR